MLAFIIAGDDETALRRGRRLCERLEVTTLWGAGGGGVVMNSCIAGQVITLAVSLGGTESLIESPPRLQRSLPRRTFSDPSRNLPCRHPASMTHAMIPRADRLAGGGCSRDAPRLRPESRVEEAEVQPRCSRGGVSSS